MSVESKEPTSEKKSSSEITICIEPFSPNEEVSLNKGTVFLATAKIGKKGQKGIYLIVNKKETSFSGFWITGKEIEIPEPGKLVIKDPKFALMGTTKREDFYDEPPLQPLGKITDPNSLKVLKSLIEKYFGIGDKEVEQFLNNFFK